MKSLHGKVAIVTGASRGVGKGVALGLAKQGAVVYVTGRTTHDEDLPHFLKGTTIHNTAKEINELGGIGIAVRCDHANDENVKSLFSQVMREQGKVDILVNNAWSGAKHVMEGYFWNTPFWQQPISLFDDFYTVGLRSAYVTSQHAAKIMAAQKSGLIVNISFYSAKRYWINVSHGVFKAALDKLSTDTAHELKEYGVSVFSLYPGNVRTEGMIEAAKYNSDLDISAMESPQFIGQCISALATDDSIIESGTVLIAAEIAQKYKFTDVNGYQPPSLRPNLWTGKD